MIKEYTEFIVSQVKSIEFVPLFQIAGVNNDEVIHVQGGLKSYLPVNVNLLEKQGRFAIYELCFHTYKLKVELFVSRKKGPEEILFDFNKKIKDMVTRTLIDNKEFDFVNDINKKTFENFSEQLRNLTSK